MGRPSRDPSVALNNWFTRADAGRVLEMSAAGVRHLEERGILKGVVDGGGVHRYNPTAVHELALRRKFKKDRRTGRGKALPATEGAFEARVFELLDQYTKGGETDTLKIKRLVVTELGITGEQFAKYYEDYTTPPDAQIQARKREELQTRHDRRERERAELAARLRSEELRVQKEEQRRDAQFMKELRRYGPRKAKGSAVELPTLPTLSETDKADDGEGEHE